MRGLATLLVLLCLAALPASAQSPVPPPAPAEHLVLVDTSGSMRTGGFGSADHFSGAFQGWVGTLFAASGPYFRSGDSIAFRAFSEEETEAGEEARGLRRQAGPVPLGEAGETFAGLAGPGGGATDLERVLTTLVGQRQADRPVRFVWIFTDNENNLGQKRSDREFYRLLRDEGDFDAVYFFPMARPAGEGGSDRGGALVLYLLVDAADPVKPWIDGFVEEVERRLGFEGVLFRPLYTDLERPVLQVGHDVEVSDPQGRFRKPINDNPLVVDLHRKGKSWEGRVRFHLRSRMDGWEIAGARLKASLQAARDGAAVQDLNPRQLDVQPNQESTQQYVLTIRAAKPLPDGKLLADLHVDAEIRLSADGPSPNLQPAVSPEVLGRMQAVAGLGEILGFMQHQADEAQQRDGEESRTIRLRQPVELRTPAPGTAWGVWASLGGLALLLFLALLAWGLAGRAYLLTTPTEERRIRLGGAFRRFDLESRSGEILGHLAPGGAEVLVVPGEEIRVDGQETPLEVEPRLGEVRFALQGSKGEASVFMLARPGAAAGGSATDEGLSL